MHKPELQNIATTTALAISMLMSVALAIMPAAHADTGSNTQRHQTATHLDDRAWINSVGTLLYADPDHDSFFSGISISIDADTSYFSYDVYAAIDIIDQTGLIDRLHTTRTFEVYDNSRADEYHVDIDLLRDFIPDTYDLQITVFDAYDDRLLDQVSARDFQNLRNLPLESEDYIDTFIPVEDRPERPVNDSVFVVEYAGSGGKWLLFFLLICVGIKTANGRTRREHQGA